MDANVLIVSNPLVISLVNVVLMSFSIIVAIHVLIPIIPVITLLRISSLVRLPKSGQPKTCTHLHPKDYILIAEYKLLPTATYSCVKEACVYLPA